MVRDVTDGGVALGDAVTERRPAVRDRRRAQRGRPDLPLGRRRLPERHVAGQLPHLHRRQRRRDVAARSAPASDASAAFGPQIASSVRGPERRREEHEALDVVEVEVGEEDVHARGLLVQRQPEAADAGARVEHHDGAVGERDLHARGVAAVARGLGPGRGDRPARPPDLHLHVSGSPSPVVQKIPSAPGKPSVATIGMALTSISRQPPWSTVWIWWRWCAGRPLRSAMVSGSWSNGSGSPLVPEGPQARVHSSGGIVPPPRSAARAAPPRPRCRRPPPPRRPPGRRAWTGRRSGCGQG